MRMIKGNSGNEDDENDVEQYRRRASFIDENDLMIEMRMMLRRVKEACPSPAARMTARPEKLPQLHQCLLHSCTPLTSAPQKIHLLEILHGPSTGPS